MEELDLKELFDMFWKKRLVIVLTVIMFALIGGIYSYYFVTPEYKATASLVLVQDLDKTSKTSQSVYQEDSGITTTDLTRNKNLVSTYSELIKSDTILEQVADNLGFDKSQINKLKKKCSVNAKDDTEIIEINVINEEPEFAANVANEINKVFSEKIVEIYNISNIYLVDAAKVPEEPCNINHIKDIVIFAFVGIVLSCGIILVVNLFDTTIKSEKDIEDEIGLTVLSAIPDYNLEEKINKGGKKRR